MSITKLCFTFGTNTVRDISQHYWDYTSLAIGLPTIQQYPLRERAVNHEISALGLIFRALRRLRRNRIVFFKKIWSKTNYSVAFRVWLTFVLFETTLDLLLTLLLFTLYYFTMYNQIAQLCTPLVLIYLIGLVEHSNNAYPFFVWIGLSTYLFTTWLYCLSFPFEVRWLAYNFTHVAVHRLADYYPGKGAWKYIVLFYVYVMLRAVEDSVLSEIAWIQVYQFFKENEGISNQLDISVFEVYTAFLDQLPNIHNLLEKGSVEIMDKVFRVCFTKRGITGFLEFIQSLFK